MNNPRLAGRYAKSLIDLAKELNQVDIVCTDMKFVQSICKSNPDFVLVLRSPIIKPGTKEKIIESITTGRVNITTSSFIRLLVRKGRETNLPEIANAYIEQFNTLRNIHRLKIITAGPISDDLKNAIVGNVKASTSFQNIEVETAIKEELIGGYVLEMEGALIDASILKDLKDIKKQFMDNQYIHKLR
ncbi:ATP synthase F1 subunit delta [Ferruginibacter sp.]|jgi:F-type H+-transporting ATPase subunit delta|uniref:ATP synthase F1 subunit delta n=1 Tax=Ferruginibacter sp. TaxID=1940288 RepID=UPI0019861637|nr:ATP synthase F1 subunit delta [Ferruginibacter sp.]MBC7628189.1 ATP synthase F1 subunit delta [Ferruginibacter sp.]